MKHDLARDAYAVSIVCAITALASLLVSDWWVALIIGAFGVIAYGIHEGVRGG